MDSRSIRSACTHRTALAQIDRSQPLLDRLDGFQPLRQVQQLLIGFGVLDDDFRLAVHGQHERMAVLFQSVEEFRRVALGGLLQ